MKLVTLLALVAIAVTSATASAAVPAFTNGPLVARKMEAHLNGADYKRRLATQGVSITRRVLCAHDEILNRVECTGGMRAKGIRITAHWTLEKRTAHRAKLSWEFDGKGVFDYDSEIISPSAFGLRRF